MIARINFDTRTVRDKLAGSAHERGQGTRAEPARTPAPGVRLPAIYAGWVLVDTRLTLFVVGVSVLMALGVLALYVKQRKWYEYAAFGFAVFSIVAVGLATVLALLLNRAPFLIESFFALP